MTKLLLPGLLLLATVACGPSPVPTGDDADEVENAIRQLAAVVAAYDYEAYRAAITPDFEIIDAGMRMDRDEFEALLRRMEARGASLDFVLSDFNTEIAGQVAYTSFHNLNRNSGSEFLESMILRRSEDGWLVDRYISARLP